MGATKKMSFRVREEDHKKYLIHSITQLQYNSFQDFVLKSMENQFKKDKKQDAKKNRNS